ncbi:MAG: thiamine diphosphokinase [Deltaproteobacteria bacterium]|jgi:thiamine pyrophosphokinase|nr:thiamine diphosphokinase [Deltaproteobacteria bacterium]
MEPNPRIWLFLNGPWLDGPFPPSPGESWVLAADGGAEGLIKLGWPAHLLVGDLDSLPASSLERLPKAPGFELLTFPKNKDQTDFELLWPLALDRLEPPGSIAIITGLGGRWDMTLANLLLPWAKPYRRRWLGGLITFWAGAQRIHCLQGPMDLTIPKECLFSLIPVIGAVESLSISGDVAYPLTEGRLSWGLTRGLSNETGSGLGLVSLRKGSLLVTVTPKTA